MFNLLSYIDRFKNSTPIVRAAHFDIGGTLSASHYSVWVACSSVPLQIVVIASRCQRQSIAMMSVEPQTHHTNKKKKTWLQMCCYSWKHGNLLVLAIVRMNERLKRPSSSHVIFWCTWFECTSRSHQCECNSQQCSKIIKHFQHQSMQLGHTYTEISTGVFIKCIM